MQTTTDTSRHFDRWRLASGLNAVAAAAALVIKFADAMTTADPQFPTVFGRFANELCYFTIQSNIIVLVVSAALALGPRRWSWMSGTPRLVGLVCITVTAVVYYAVLAADQHYVGIAKVGDVLAHAVSPLLFVGTWLLSRRGRFARHHVIEMLVYPVFWIALTLMRGAVIHIYPYDFVDVMANGYVSVTATIVVITAVAAALAMAAVRVDQRKAMRYSTVP